MTTASAAAHHQDTHLPQAALSKKFAEDGFLVLPDIYTGEETGLLQQQIEAADTTRSTFRRTKDLFAIRQFLKEVPQSIPVIFNTRLLGLIQSLFGSSCFVTKSIYFDKPAQSNWFVAYHQDLTISVNQKTALDGFGPWTAKQDQYAVQPALLYLEQGITIRIHLDDTTKDNGALKVIPGSHRQGIIRPEQLSGFTGEQVVTVPEGGIMLMRPLLLHASGRTLNRQRRRVIHIELNQAALPSGLQWSEYLPLPYIS